MPIFMQICFSPVHSVIPFKFFIRVVISNQIINVSDLPDACLAAILDHKKEVYT